MILKAENISKLLKGSDNKSIKVLNDINLALKKGEFIVVLGPSGSGKTTLLQILGLMDTPTSGSLILLNREANKLSADEKAFMRANNIGFVFQTPLLINDLTLEQNLELVIKVSKTKISKEKIDYILDRVDLADKKHYYPRMLSMGEAQRGSLARAVINDPQIIFADEATSNLDKPNKFKILELLKLFNDENKVNIVLASHDNFVLNYCSRHIVLKDGKLSN